MYLEKKNIIEDVPINIFRNIKDNQPKEQILLSKILNLIRNGKWKKAIENLRKQLAEGDKTTYDKDKKCLSYFTVSGIFKDKRKSQNIEIYTGLIVLDIDKLASIEEAERLKKYLVKKCPFVLSIFISPSGKGLKIIIPTDNKEGKDETHKRYFKALLQYFKKAFELKVDSSGSDIARACFVSYDPNIYINWKCCMFTLEQNTESTSSTTLTDEQEIFDRCVKAMENKGQTFVEGKRHDFIFHLACICNRYGLHETFTKSAIIAQYGHLMNDQNHHLKTIQNVYENNQQEHQTHYFEVHHKANGNDKVHKNNKSDQYFQEYEYGVKDGMYYVLGGKGSQVTERRISNFTMKILYLLMDNSKANNSRRIIQLTNRYQEVALLDISTQELLKCQSAKAAFSAQGNFLFKGSSYHLQSILENLFSKEIRAKEIEIMGFQKDSKVYAFANGIFDIRQFHKANDFGIVQLTRNHFYLPTASKMNTQRKSFEEYRKFEYLTTSKIDFIQWAILIGQVYGIKGKLSICYLIASLFRDIIFEDLKFFPHLFYYGKSGAGKSMQAESFIALFGKGIKPLSIAGASTPKAFLATLSQYANMMVYFEEYKNSVQLEKGEALKDAYNGYGYRTKAFSNDNTTLNNSVLSSCFITGQELPTKDIALYKRCIILEFFETVRTIEKTEKYTELKDLEKQGMSHILTTILKHRKYFQEHFASHRKNIANKLKTVHLKDQNIEDRLIANYAIILASFETLKHKLTFPFKYEEILESVLLQICHQNDTINNSDEVARFWSIVHYLMNDGIMGESTNIETDVRYIKQPTLQVGKDYRIFSHNNLRVLGIRFKAFHTAYMKEYYNRYKTIGIDESTLRTYIINDNSFIANGDSKTKAIRLPKYNASSIKVYMFSYNQLQTSYFDIED